MCLLLGFNVIHFGSGQVRGVGLGGMVNLYTSRWSGFIIKSSLVIVKSTRDLSIIFFMFRESVYD